MPLYLHLSIIHFDTRQPPRFHCLVGCISASYITTYLDPNLLTPHFEELSLNFPCLEPTVNPDRSFDITIHIFAESILDLHHMLLASSSMLANWITFDCAMRPSSHYPETLWIWAAAFAAVWYATIASVWLS